MRTARKIASGVILGLAGIASLGYATAWVSLSSCADATYEEILRKGTTGTDMLGAKVPLSRSAVTARVAGPFLVEARYMVPADMHGVLHFKKYVVLPWKRYERSSRAVPLVIAPLGPKPLSANNSFKPKPLRGSA